jgi:C-terminal processing protease CtpA/Prc
MDYRVVVMLVLLDRSLFMHSNLFRLMLTLVIAFASLAPLSAQDAEIPPAEIENDEGGPVTITGSVTYTDPLFVAGVAEPLVILEDQAGFVDRNRSFLMAEESQVMGQITSDFFTSPFAYSISLPIEPEASLRDVDNDGEDDTGVMVYAVAYWTNTWGDPFLEERDLFGGGWSTTYASTRVDPDPSAEGEIIGGTYLIYAPDDQQGFPFGFGDDGLLFTEDDPVVSVPQGYTVVNLDTDPFTFDRSHEMVIDLIESEQSAAEDFSSLSYTEAFDAMIDLFRTKYAFTEYKGLDWDAISDEFRPRFEEAEANNDPRAYLLALRDFTWSIPDGHVGGSFNSLNDLFVAETDGGLGMAIRELDDGRVITNFILSDGPADQAGIELGAEILEINGQPITDVVSETVPWSSPFSTDHVRRLQQLRYAVRFLLNTEVEVTYQNPADTEPTTTSLTAVAERDSFSFSSFNAGLTGFELPIDYRILDSGYAYVKIYSFFDNALLTIQLWERMIQTLNANEVPGLIIDMRQNGGGNGFLADQMAAYFFDESLTLGNTGYYDEALGEFYFDPRLEGLYHLPPENLRYHGPITILVGPSCASACEFFSYDMTLQDRASVVGQYPTAGLGGSIEAFFMPEGEVLQFTTGRAVNGDGEIHIEGIGVVPTVKVPVNEETLFGDGDPILKAAIAHLDESTAVAVEEGGEIAVGDTVTGQLAPNSRVRYSLPVSEGDNISIFLRDETGQFDTYLRLYDSDGNLLAENDDSEPGTTVNSALEELIVPQDMTLVIEAATFEDSGEGEYTLEVVANE